MPTPQKTLIDAQSTSSLIDAVSDQLVAMLATAGYPRLTPLSNGKPGRIVVGEPGAEFSELMPPRVIFRPLKSDFLAPDMSMGAVTLAGDDRASLAHKDRMSALKNRAIWTEEITFEVWCSSSAPRGTFNSEMIGDAWRVDYEYTRFLAHNVIAAMHVVMPNAYGLAGGIWASRRHIERIMREFIFRVEFRIPVLREPPFTLAVQGVAGLDQAPDDVAPEITDLFTTNLGTGPGCE